MASSLAAASEVDSRLLPTGTPPLSSCDVSGLKPSAFVLISDCSQETINLSRSPPPPPAAPVAKAVRVVKVTSDIANGQLRTPGRIPAKVQMIKEDDAPPPTAISEGVVGGVPGGVPGGQLGGVIGGIISSSSSLAAVPTLSKPAAMPQRVRVSQGVSKGLLVYHIDPPTHSSPWWSIRRNVRAVTFLCPSGRPSADCCWRRRLCSASPCACLSPAE